MSSCCSPCGGTYDARIAQNKNRTPKITAITPGGARPAGSLARPWRAWQAWGRRTFCACWGTEASSHRAHDTPAQVTSRGLIMHIKRSIYIKMFNYIPDCYHTMSSGTFNIYVRTRSIPWCYVDSSHLQNCVSERPPTLTSPMVTLVRYCSIGTRS